MLAACGGQSSSTPSNQNTTPIQGPNETRSPIEKRRDAACDTLAPKITQCAVDDAKADLAAGKITKAQFDKDAAPEVVRKNSEEYAAKCKSQQLSSRQVRVLEASRLVGITPDILKGLARQVDVFARVSPTHKYQIVQALQAGGEVVAMTGDGVNDAPALKGSDIGVAMGARGTELARDLADVVLLDDNFSSIVGAVEQGRTIYANIRKALKFLLATNFSEIIVTVAAMALGVARPMSALQFLWINLLTDVFPALALSFEPAEPQVMEQPPRNPADPILSRQTLTGMAADAGLISAVTLGAYGLAVSRYGVGAPATTVAFSTLTSAQLCYAITCRSEHRSGFSGLDRNPLLLAALGGTLALQVAAVVAPPLRRLLGTTPLGAADWGLVATGAVVPLIVKEASKVTSMPALSQGTIRVG